MSYLKEMKNESIEIIIHPVAKKFLLDRKCGLNDLSNLSDEDIINFKELFFENRVSRFHKGTGKMMETLYDYIIDILNRRVPVPSIFGLDANPERLIKLLYVFIVIPSFVRDIFYSVVAHNRYRWFGKSEKCLLPTTENLDRFII
jgi:hypothetical protein